MTDKKDIFEKEVRNSLGYNNRILCQYFNNDAIKEIQTKQHIYKAHKFCQAATIKVTNLNADQVVSIILQELDKNPRFDNNRVVKGYGFKDIKVYIKEHGLDSNAYINPDLFPSKTYDKEDEGGFDFIPAGFLHKEVVTKMYDFTRLLPGPNKFDGTVTITNEAKVSKSLDYIIALRDLLKNICKINTFDFDHKATRQGLIDRYVELNKKPEAELVINVEKNGQTALFPIENKTFQKTIKVPSR